VAVYTEVTDSQLSAFLRNYNIGALVEKTPITEGVENTNYQIDTRRGRYILTLFEKRVDKDDLPFFMALKKHLAKKGAPVPAPVTRVDGQTISELNGRPAVIIEFMSGRPVMAPNAEACAAMGAALGRLHLSVSDFPLTRVNPLSIGGWKDLAAACRNADKIEPGLTAFIDAELAFIGSAWPHDLPGGVVHTDLFPDNILFEKGAVSGVIDFYFACNDFFSYDLATCINAWCFDQNGKFHPERSKALVSAYLAIRPLDSREITAMQTLLRGSALRFLLTRTYDCLNQNHGVLVTVKDPLVFRSTLAFHQSGAASAFYGLGDD